MLKVISFCKAVANPPAILFKLFGLKLDLTYLLRYSSYCFCILPSISREFTVCKPVTDSTK
ncbi:hypothetical protein [Campylobacter pinnipediorum]|uniref:hypothetical protein n=1 Tax=Campylobacter pinnipediorum TaxID=1965231 RepID=UPI001E41D03E